MKNLVVCLDGEFLLQKIACPIHPLLYRIYIDEYIRRVHEETGLYPSSAV